MATNQQPSAQQTVREEERVLGITYDRAVTMVPKLIEKTTGITPTELGDGYFLCQLQDGRQRREITVRLGRQGPDTRVSIRVESFTQALTVTLIIIFAIATMGLGILPLIPWMQQSARNEQRQRDLLVHKTFRAIEDAVAEQGISTNYRIGPGADAVKKQSEEEAAIEEAAATEAAQAANEAKP